MWKASVGTNVKPNTAPQDDDWETDADFVNDVSEKEQRWGSKTVEGSGKPKEALDLSQVRQNVVSKNETAVKQDYASKPGFSYGYGGKFGVQTDRMDKSAVGFDAMDAPKHDHSSIPRYEKPSIAVKPTDLKKKFEVGPVTDANKIEEARKARAEKDRLDRERIKAEQEALRAKELAKAKDEEDKRQIEEAQARARAQEEEEARLAEAQIEAAAAAAVQAQDQDQVQVQVQADSQYSSFVEGSGSTTFEGGFTATAVYEYEAGGDDELGFKEGDVITNIETIDEGWWRGECNGRYGLFPANYVQAN